MKPIDLFAAAGQLAFVHDDIPLDLNPIVGLTPIHQDDGTVNDGSLPDRRWEQGHSINRVRSLRELGAISVPIHRVEDAMKPMVHPPTPWLGRRIMPKSPQDKSGG